ncbi:hypothetical protein N9449_03960 [Oceanospirillaceae bacterium]|nr:hypothetical protein [Oceanospirillaceae bacterium]
MSPIRGILLLALFFTTMNVSAEAIIPSEEEKNQLTVYMIKSPVDDPIFTTDIDGNFIFSNTSRRLQDEVIDSNACLLVNTTGNGDYDYIRRMYRNIDVKFSDDANLYLVDGIYEAYGIENLAIILSNDSEQSIQQMAKTSGLNLKVETNCKNIKEAKQTNLHQNSDLYFVPGFLYTRWLELGDELAQKITDDDVVGVWEFDEIKALSDNYRIALDKENEINNALQAQFLSLAEQKSQEFMSSLYLISNYEYKAQHFCTLSYSGDDGVAAIGYRLMGDEMLIDKELINYFDKEEITVNYNDTNQSYFEHTFDDINAAFLSIKNKLNANDKGYCNFFVDYPENILKLKNAIDRDVGSYTAIGKAYSKEDTANQFAIGQGYDNYDQYSFANNIGANQRDIASLKKFGIENQLAYDKSLAEMVASKYSEDTSISSVLTYYVDLKAATEKSMNILDYRAARVKEEKRRADIARAQEQKRIEEFAREYPYTATLSCGMGSGDHINVVACFVQTKYGAPTELEIQNGQDYRMYKPYNVSQAGNEYSSGLEINLKNRFSIMAQNSSENLVLTLKIVDNATGKTIYADSAAQYGVVRYAK